MAFENLSTFLVSILMIFGTANCSFQKEYCMYASIVNHKALLTRYQDLLSASMVKGMVQMESTLFIFFLSKSVNLYFALLLLKDQ